MFYDVRGLGLYGFDALKIYHYSFDEVEYN